MCFVLLGYDKFITISLIYLHGSLRVAPMARGNHNASGVTLKDTAKGVQYRTATNTTMCVPLWVVSIAVNQTAVGTLQQALFVLMHSPTSDLTAVNSPIEFWKEIFEVK